MDNKELRDGITRTTLLVQILKELEKELDKKEKTKEEEKCGPEPVSDPQFTDGNEQSDKFMDFASALKILQDETTEGYMIREDWLDKVLFIGSTYHDTLYMATTYLDENGEILEEYTRPYHVTDADLLEWRWSVVDKSYKE